MSLREKIVETIVVKGQERTVSQMAAQFKTTVNSVRSTIHALREAGQPIGLRRNVDSKGRRKNFYVRLSD